jgi:hypothetical protein
MPAGPSVPVDLGFAVGLAGQPALPTFGTGLFVAAVLAAVVI